MRRKKQVLQYICIDRVGNCLEQGKNPLLLSCMFSHAPAAAYRSVDEIIPASTSCIACSLTSVATRVPYDGPFLTRCTYKLTLVVSSWPTFMLSICSSPECSPGIAFLS